MNFRNCPFRKANRPKEGEPMNLMEYTVHLMEDKGMEDDKAWKKAYVDFGMMKEEQS